MNEFRPVIGLEIHLELNTASKVFCGCRARVWQEQPNQHTCPVCLGLPGALPVLNLRALESALRLTLALGGEIQPQSYFERKNYFYPDLPKGYQISQKRVPLGRGGFLEVLGKRVALWEIHLEEDTAKSLHTGEATLLDFNKSGVPLVEVVSAPVIDSVELLDAYAKELREVARALGITGGDMEKGEMRFEANISLVPAAAETGTLPEYRVEIKNLNSFKALRDSSSYEIARQTEALARGEKLVQETRGWDAEGRRTFTQREKESANDYRYFPEPDLPPLELGPALLKPLRDALPELPAARRARFESLGLAPNAAATLAADEPRRKYYEDLTRLGATAPQAAALVINRPEVLDRPPEEVWAEEQNRKSAYVIAEADLSALVQKIIAANPGPVGDYRQGKTAALQFLVGQLMKETKGAAAPQLCARLVKEALSPGASAE